MLKHSCWAAIFAMIAGCTIFPSIEQESAVTAPTPVPIVDYARENAEVSALLAYYQALLSMPADELRREYQGTSQAVARDKTELSRLRLALLLCVPGIPWRDDARVLALLDRAAVRDSAVESPRRQFVILLQRLVAERQREQRRAEDLAAEKQREQRRADELQRKLDAMLDIERNLRTPYKKP